MEASACVCTGAIVVSRDGRRVASEYAGGCCRVGRRWDWYGRRHFLSIGIGTAGTRVPIIVILPASYKWWMTMRYVNAVVRCHSSNDRLIAFDWHGSLSADSVVR